MLATTPMFTTVLSMAFRQEKIATMALAGVALSFLGIALVVWGGTQAVAFSADTVRGDLTTLAAAFAWSSYTVGSAPLVRRYGALPVTAVTMWIGALVLLAVSVPAFLAQDWSAVRPVSWVALSTAARLPSRCPTSSGTTASARSVPRGPLSIPISFPWSR